jgi:CheY-like chemotaxis protein
VLGRTGIGNNNILVVEDDADYREMVMLFLRRSGYRAVEAVTGLEAVSRARVTRPNLILMDLDMPAMTGDQATARLKADPSTRNIPVIVTTAFSYGSLVDRAIMHKPFALKLLRAAMQRHYQPDGMSNGKKTKKGSTEWALGQPLVFPKTHNPTDVNLPPRCHRFRQY